MLVTTVGPPIIKNPLFDIDKSEIIVRVAVHFDYDFSFISCLGTRFPITIF